jgi:uncharacterized RDD family membrane protein YckC
MSEPTSTQYGGFWVRFLALLADSALLFLIGTALLIGAAVALGPEGVMPATFAVWLLGFLYWPLMHASGWQATLGKAMVGLKVARFDGERISILRSLWRELAKIFSAAVLMLGYLMAAVLPRKQGLHDLMAATYVVREGPSRVIVAFLVAVAGFAAPVVVVPMVVDAGVTATITSVAEGMVPQDVMKQVPAPVQDLMKQALGSAQELIKRAVGSAQDLMKQAARPSSTAPKAAPKSPPAPAPVAKAPAAKSGVAASKPAAPASKPESDALAQPAPAPKPAAPKPVVRLKPPPPPSTSKTGSGTRYNDLLTAVMYQDVEGVNELVRLGKWVDKPDSRGVTPLMIAAERGDLRVAEALLRGGANARLAVPVAERRRDDEMVRLLKRYAGR